MVDGGGLERPIRPLVEFANFPVKAARHPSVEDARAGAKLMYQNDRVLCVMVVTDSLGSFVERIEAMTAVR